ncbi:circularly permuted type 2 ATP-grasp protein [Brachybacterium sp. AOP25-B2-12]|uniref:circularly permuted type 2 ATP-grasp protein n=1 Tax=Brachybacterium sp. AOP25-B2-12 TaxID=3457710 RepID=UPI0040343450
MDDLLAHYPPSGTGTFDEMVGPDGIRPQYRTMTQVFDGLGAQELAARDAYLGTRYLDTGVTFDFSGREEPFPVDIIPRLIQAAEWERVEQGLKQRVTVLERFLADVYGAGQLFDDGVIPRALVTTSHNFIREVAGYQPPTGVRIHVAGIDLVRDGEGTLRVLEDNVRIPSGVSYVLTNRQAITAALPEAVRRYAMAPVDEYPARLRAALAASAPPGVSDPNVVVMSPGVFNSAYFEHSLLARTMGVPLVEGRDLVARQGRVYLRDTSGLQPVDVIYRRVDDEFLDPVHFRHDSMLGCAGLVSAQANGTVTIANAIGNGVADDKLLYSYLPALTRYYLGEEPLIPNVDTWRLEDPEQREEVMDRLAELVVKPVDGSGGKGIVIGPHCDAEELEQVREHVLSDPRGFIAQPLIQLSTVPTVIEGTLRPRHVDLRPFVVNDGQSMWVLPGGLTRVARGEGQFIVNSSQGGASKDTWILQGETSAEADDEAGTLVEHEVNIVAPEISEVDAAGAQQQQQQQGRRAPWKRAHPVRDGASTPSGPAPRGTTQEGSTC